MNYKKIKFVLSFLLVLLCLVSNVFAQVSVHGYYRKDGTYVKGYQRTYPDNSPYNNYSYPGNYNPNTGKITPGNQDTYLRNYYGNDSDYSFDNKLPKTYLKHYNSEQNEIADYNYNYKTNPSFSSHKSYSLSQEISILQSALELTGHNPGPIDGVWGPKTKSAIKDLQKDHGIYESGRINDETFSALKNEIDKLSPKSKIDILSNNNWLKGTWSGTGYELNYDDSWKIKISFTERGYFVKYISPNCSGRWIFKNVVNNKMIFQEKLEEGVTNCADNIRVTLSKFSNNKIRLKFYYQNSNDLAAHAFLTKK